MFDYAAAGERLYALRVALGRSRSDVVRDSDGTLDETYLGRVETGVAVASALRVRRALARGLGVRTDDLTDLLDGRLTVERVVERATATLAERLMLAGAEHDTVADLVLYLRDELASVTAERDALRAIVERTREVVRGTDHMDDCPADHSFCGPNEGGWDCAGGRTEEECRAYTVEGCTCGVGPLRVALGMEVSHG